MAAVVAADVAEDVRMLMLSVQFVSVLICCGLWGHGCVQLWINHCSDILS